jgi:hypothetical protein
MLKNKLKAHHGFTPDTVAPQNAITPEQVICHHHSKRRGGMGHCPFRHLTNDLYFIS